MNGDNLLDNKYKIKKRLGRGGFGIVYLADDVVAKRKVAIKALLERDSIEQQTDLIKETRFLASLQHKSIVTFYHNFYEEEILYLVMEYCSGGSLDNLISSKKNIQFDDALKIAIDICEVFEFIHSKNIIHRDIKPNNILIDADSNIKVSDFGIANTHGGTLSYLAPEVLSTEYASSKDARVDIYSLGITLLEMITGINPFYGADGQEMISRKINHNFVPTNLPQWLLSIILRSTHPTPELRFQTATEFKQALISKTVPFDINKEKIKNNKIFEVAYKSLQMKSWQKSIKYIIRGLERDDNSALGLMTAGQYYIKIHQMDKAKEYFERALKVNPSVNIKKELAEINLGNKNYSLSISLLQNYLQLNPTDWEAYNLLVECFYRLERFETGLEILESIIDEVKKDCYWNNWFIIKYCLGHDLVKTMRQAESHVKFQHFINENFKIITAIIENRVDTQKFHNKLIYQDYRFTSPYNKNTLIIEDVNGNRETFVKPIITVGRNQDNDYPIEEKIVSRLHCVLINYLKDIWIIDLGSKYGVSVDDKKILSKQFLLGKHKVSIGDVSFYVYTDAGIIL